MKKTMTLGGAKTVLGENVHEIPDGFLFVDLGKYKPNVTFLLPREWDLDGKGNPISPVEEMPRTYEKSPEVEAMLANMNQGFGGEGSVIFGDFWRPKKGGACFCPKHPSRAKHLLVCIDWGGGFRNTRGVGMSLMWQAGDHNNSKFKAATENLGVLYFRKASSAGGGRGYDYWIVPIGWKKTLNEDGEGTGYIIDQDEAKRIRKEFGALKDEATAEADRLLREKLAAEAKSREDKERYVARLEAVNVRLEALGKSSFEFDETSFGYKNGLKRLYTEAEVGAAEADVADAEDREVKRLAFEAEKAAAKAEFAPKFEELSQRVEACGWQLELGETAKVKVPYARTYGFKVYNEFRTDEYQFGISGLADCVSLIEAQEAIRAEAEAKAVKEALEAEAKAAGLPSDIRIWHRSGATNAGKGWVIRPNGMERECDWVDTSMHGSNSKRNFQSYEGNHVWSQILPGEVVLSWAHAFTAAEHEFEVIYCPEQITEAQAEVIAEIEKGIENAHFGRSGLTGSRCPSIGDGWGLVK